MQTSLCEEALVEEGYISQGWRPLVCFKAPFCGSEKVTKRMDCAIAQGRDEEAQKLREKLKDLYYLRQSLRNSIRDMLFQAVRCGEDLCLLQGEENETQGPERVSQKA